MSATRKEEESHWVGRAELRARAHLANNRALTMGHSDNFSTILPHCFSAQKENTMRPLICYGPRLAGKVRAGSVLAVK